MNLNKLFSSEFRNPEIPKKLFGISAIIALFIMAFRAPLDPDLQWHLKTGELMWQYKTIPHIDWFSYTMSDFPWINHEWLAEILMYIIKNSFGWAGLAIFFAAITVFIFAWIVPKISRNIETKNYPFYTSLILGILGALTSSLIFGPRPQIFNLLGIAMILYIINEYQFNNRSKIIYALPVLFLLWTNMHASFIMGLGLLGIYLMLDRSLSTPAALHPKAEWLKLYRPLSPEAWKKLSYFAVLSFAATFVNPYGARIYEEVFNTLSDSYGRNIIIEWLAPNFHNTEGMILGFYIIITLVILSVAKKIDVFSLVLIPLFLFLALQATRNIPEFVVISLPVLIKSLEGFEKVFTAVMQKKAIAFTLCAFLIFYPLYLFEIKNVIKTMSSDKELIKFAQFPQRETLVFLENYRAKNPGNMLNDYGWGGYLIANSDWHMTEGKITGNSKVFIDGRMSFWRTPDRHILKDFIDMINLKSNANELMAKYQIKTIFINKDSMLGYSLAYNNKWRKIYEDNIAVIYEKIN